jgi:Uma2 family endonuclease
MHTATDLDLLSVEDYLAGEIISPVKRDYVYGQVYARSETCNQHNLIATNALGALSCRFRGGHCLAYNSDTKIRIRLKGQVCFYYPDISVVCRPIPPDDSFYDEPTALFEVLSHRTSRLDLGEKKDAYLTIASLVVYVLIEQDMPAVVVFRRVGDNFVREVYQGLDAVVPLGEIGIELPLAEIYEAVEFVPEREDENEMTT